MVSVKVKKGTDEYTFDMFWFQNIRIAVVDVLVATYIHSL